MRLFPRITLASIAAALSFAVAIGASSARAGDGPGIGGRDDDTRLVPKEMFIVGDDVVAVAKNSATGSYHGISAPIDGLPVDVVDMLNHELDRQAPPALFSERGLLVMFMVDGPIVGLYIDGDGAHELRSLDGERSWLEPDFEMSDTDCRNPESACTLHCRNEACREHPIRWLCHGWEAIRCFFRELPL